MGGDRSDHAGVDHERQRDESSGNARRGAPGKRLQEADAGPLPLTVQRIGVYEQARPDDIDRGIYDAEDQAEEDVADQRPEQFARALRRPVGGGAAAIGKRVSCARNHQNMA